MKESTRSRRIWLTWETQRRNRELACAFDAALFCFDHGGSGFGRYVYCTRHSLVALILRRPQILFVQCPSIVLLLFGTFWSFVSRCKLIVDAHNSAVESALASGLIGRAVRYCLRCADGVIFSNPLLAQKMAKFQINCLILPDRLPHITPTHIDATDGDIPFVVLIASFAPDEPIKEFLEGATRVQKEFCLFVTGKRSKAGSLLRYESDVIRFTDFLSERDYELLLNRAAVIVDLTTREDCLVCGAYEGLVLGKPLILSNHRVNHVTFPKGTIFASNSPQDYQDAIDYALRNLSALSNDARLMKEIFSEQWEQAFASVDSFVGSIEGE